MAKEDGAKLIMIQMTKMEAVVPEAYNVKPAKYFEFDVCIVLENAINLSCALLQKIFTKR